MCDTTENLDEYIEYEFARDCIEIDGECEDVDGNDIVHNDHQSLLVPQSEHLPEEAFLYEDDYEIVEELDDDVDQVLIADTALDIKTEILSDHEEDKEFINEDTEEDHLIDEETANGYGQEVENLQELEYEEIGLDDEDQAKPETRSSGTVEKVAPITEKNKRPPPKPCPEDKGPRGVARRYLLYDELVATIVDYDPDGTPIVEFSVSNNDADEKLPVECGICPDVMSRAKVTTHLKTHLVPGTNRYQCIYCEETYKDCKYLAGHARRHMGIRPYVCEVCKLYFSTKQDLRVHNQRRHQEKDHICEVCGKTFAQNTQLKRHREATHEKKRRFNCDICPKSYYKNFSLQEHIRAVHMGKRRIIVCPFCGMQCRDAHKMARHRKQYHLHQTHFECHICNEEFTDINYFDAHKRSIQCRNNTRRKQEEEGMLQQQQEEEKLLLVQTQQVNDSEISKQDILLEEDNSQQYCQNSNDPQNPNYQLDQNQQHSHIDDDTIETVQMIEECDYKHLISSSPQQHQDHTGHFMLSNDLLTHEKIEEISADEVGDDEELVYEITIDSNE